MLRRLRLGVHADGEGTAGWTRIVRQELLPWRFVDGPQEDIVLFSGVLPDWCADFVRSGGIAIVSGMPRADDLLGESTLATIQRFRPPAGDRDCFMPGPARLFRGEGHGVCRLHENRKAREGRLADLHPAIHSRRLGKGWLIATGLALTTHLAAAGDMLRSFTEPSSVTERVAATDKADIADTLVWMIQQAFARRGLPYVRPARYPGGAPSVFMFRVDVDGIFGNNCRNLAFVARRHGIPASFYFNASLCRAHPGPLRREWFEGHEIGHHANRHDLFDTVQENRANLLEGMAWVREALGVTTTSYVAPRGLWNEALDRAMAELGHAYSSDFGLDFDSLPFFTPAGVLQVPVHPFSAERNAVYEEDAGRGRPSDRAVADQYQAALVRQHQLRRPCHLYGHPEVLGASAERVLPSVFEAVRQRDLPCLTVGNFAEWWLRRDGIELSLAVEEESGELQAAFSGGNHPLEIFSSSQTTVVVHDVPRSVSAGTWTLVTEDGVA